MAMLLMVFRTALLFALCAALGPLAPVGTASAQAAQDPRTTPGPPAAPYDEEDGPECRTLDERFEPAGLFAPGDEIVLQGEGFRPNARIRVLFDQDDLTPRIAQVESNQQGAFSTRDARARIPERARPGGATIRVTDGQASTTCAIRVLDRRPIIVDGAGPFSADSTGNDDLGGPFIAPWAAFLLLFGVFLAVVAFRRWRLGYEDAPHDDGLWDPDEDFDEFGAVDDTTDIRPVVGEGELDEPPVLTEADISGTLVAPRETGTSSSPGTSRTVDRLVEDVKDWTRR